MTTTSDGIISYSEPINQSGNPYNLVHADVIEWARTYKGRPFHCLICDPPYHLVSITKRFGKANSAPAKGDVYRRSSAGFMGMQWDSVDEQGKGIAFNPETWAALTEHLYPGGFILAFAGTRGYHRMACAMEDSGLVIHPALIWVNLAGFPKATRIDTQVDRAAGVEQEIIGYEHPADKYDGSKRKDAAKFTGRVLNGGEKGGSVLAPIRKPATPLAQTWAGHRYGLQALKPALEFIAVAQKPYEGRPVDCITRTGAGAWNIDGGRIGTEIIETHGNGNKYKNLKMGQSDGVGEYMSHLGRWPANLLLDEAGAELLDRQSGNRPAGSSITGDEPSETTKHVCGERERIPLEGHNDSGGASRMFFQSDWRYEILEQLENADPLKYEPKVSTAEREAGLDSLPLQTRNRVNSGGLENDPKFAPTRMRNNHPTLKPISLCKYLVTLILPPDAYAPRRICVPFCGSGSEAIGSVLAGFEQVVAIEKYPVPEKPISQENPDYIGIAEARLAWWSEWLKYGKPEVEAILAAKEVHEQQLRMF